MSLRASWRSNYSASESALRRELAEDARRDAANRRHAPVAVAAEAMVNEALGSYGLPEAAREHLEEQSAELSGLLRRGGELSESSAGELRAYIESVTARAL